MRWIGFFAVLMALPAAACGTKEIEVADLVLRGGPIWTGDAGRPKATAIAVRAGRVVAVGDSTDVEAWRGHGTRVVELAGRTALPGFIDAHTHFLSGGFQLSSVDLRDADTPTEFARRIGSFARAAGASTWITGGNWDHERWGGELPRREWIDSLTPNNPVFVSRLDGHMALANTLALTAGGLTASAAPPAGGEIVRDAAHGEPTGVLKDAAMELVTRAIPPRAPEELDRALAAASRQALSLGVTQVHDMGSWADLETYRRARAAGHLPLRIYSVVPLSTWARLRDFVSENGRGDDRLWWGGVKGFVDGSLGSTTAWFYEPYQDDPSTSGLMTTDTASLRAWITEADQAGLQVIVHAIGDRANDWLLGVYADVAAAHGARDRRFRVEHAQHLRNDAPARFRELDVVASMQPYHAVDDGRWAAKRIGLQRIRTTYAFRSLLDAGSRLAFGSDWTVAPLNPLLGLDAAVTRRTLDGNNPGGWVPEQRITLDEALRAYTAGSAYAGFMDGRTGALRPGALADIVVLSGDLFATPGTELASLRVDLTFVDGDLVFERGGEDGHE